MPKLAGNQIYCVGCHKKTTFKKDEACLYIMSNGRPSIRVHCSNCNTMGYKIIKESDTKKYTKC